MKRVIYLIILIGIIIGGLKACIHRDIPEVKTEVPVNQNTNIDKCSINQIFPNPKTVTIKGVDYLQSQLPVGDFGGRIISSTIGSLLGAGILYGLGKLLNKEHLIRIVKSKYGKLLRVKPQDIEAADRWFDTKGSITVLICRCVPIVRSLISIPAGMSDMPLPKFFLYTAVGSAIWNTLLVCVGAFAGDKKDEILALIDNISHIILLLLIVVAVIFVVWFYKKKVNKKEGSKNE